MATDETPGSYIRKRRLSEAVRQLLTSKSRILDIALDYQFDSQAAFTRAFRAMFAISPGSYRKRQWFARLTPQDHTPTAQVVSRKQQACFPPR